MSERAPLWSISSVALVAANLLPVAGVLAAGWDVADLLLVYWAESAVIGVYAIRMT